MGIIPEREFHISADAAAGGDGSRGRPFQTLTQARDGIRAARQTRTLKNGEAVTVNVESGVYRLTGSCELTAQDCGTAEAPVVYRAHTSALALVWGGVALEAASLKPVTDQSVRSRLDAAVRDNVLVCVLARDSASRWRAWLQKEMPSFETIPFEKIGLQKDEYRRTLPAR